MRGRIPGLTLVPLLFLTAVDAGAGSQEPPAAFPVEIEQVVVDVVVKGEDGQPITDLSEAEIEVYEDGVRHTTTSFEMFDAAVSPAEAAAAQAEHPVVGTRVSSNTDEEGVQGRTYVIAFDDAHLTDDTARQAREAVAGFLTSETREGDRITLVAPAAGVWWNTRMEEGREELLETVNTLQGLFEPDMQADRLTDYEAMRIHVYQDKEIARRILRRYALRGVQTAPQYAQRRFESASSEADRFGLGLINPALDPAILAKASESYAGVTARNEITLRAIEQALHSLVRRQGRKSLILVSEGFIHDTKLKGLERIVTASLRANTAIYFLNSRGMRAVMRSDEDQEMADQARELPANTFTQEFETAGGSVTLAQDTGGFVMRDTDDLALGLRRIADETRAYYLIGYNPINTDRDGKFRTIEIRVPGRDDIEIRARKGYYAPSGEAVAPGGESGEHAALQEAMDSPYAVGDIGLRMTHFVGEEAAADTARVTLAAEVDVEDLGFERQGGADVAALRFVMVAMNRASDDHFRVDQKVDLELPPEMRSELARTWLPIVREFDLGAGSYRAKIVLEDTATGRLGSVIHDFKVPAMDSPRLRVSTPVLSDMRLPAEDGQPGERLAIMARREFTPEAALYCRLEVYGAARLESSGLPRVSLSYEVRRSDGALYTRGARSLIVPTDGGDVSRTIGFPLRAATPDEYEIVMHVRDELAGRTLDVREAFSVTGPRLPAQPAGSRGERGSRGSEE